MEKFKNHYNATDFTPDDEANIGPSMTVPDMSLTVKEIMRRYANGQALPDMIDGTFDEDNDILGLDGIDINTLDISERHDLVERNRERIREMQEELREQDKQKRRQQLIEELQLEQQEQQQQQQNSNESSNSNDVQK